MECDFNLCLECYYHLHHKIDPMLLCGDSQSNSNSSSSSSSSSFSAGVGVESISAEASKNPANLFENFRSVQCSRQHNLLMSSYNKLNYVSGWRCNLCSRGSSSEGPERWFCRTCSFDICFSCVTRDKVVNPNNDMPVSKHLNIVTIHPLHIHPLPRSLDSRKFSQLGSWIIRTGTTKRSGSVNWRDLSGNIVFHLSPRLDNHSIVMNSLLDGAWSPLEEKIALLPGLSKAHEPLEITIIVSTIGFEVYWRDELLHIYCHRMPLQKFENVIALEHDFKSLTQIDSTWEIVKL